MTIKKKASKKPLIQQYDIDDVINRGGQTAIDSRQKSGPEVETRFTLRIPEKLIKKIDSDRWGRVGNVSRNQWILEAIAKRFS
jgi:hypothetical protein